MPTPFALGYPEGHAFHLQKNLYGFQHSPRAFYDAFSTFLTSTLGFERCTYDKTLFRRTTALGITYISLYVDDALVVSANEDAWTELHKEVGQKYELSSVGDSQSTTTAKTGHCDSATRATSNKLRRALASHST